VGKPADFSRIVHWEHPRGPAHCLARVFLDSPAGGTIVVLSEIRSNAELRGITSGFAGAADALWALLPGAPPVVPEKIVWIAHHGPFSYYENVGDESFTRVNLTWDGERHHGSYADQHLLSRADADRLLDGLELEPVPAAVERLGHRF
jgi:hypothetical protein